MLHFSPEEFEGRKARLMARMAEEKLDALMLFAQESMYWLTGYDTFGFCFFQCLVVKSDGEMRLLTRSADLRQARNTSNVETVVVWRDRSGADPLIELRDMLDDMDLLGAKIGVEWATHGLTAANGKALEERLVRLSARCVLSRLDAAVGEIAGRDHLCARGRPPCRRCL